MSELNSEAKIVAAQEATSYVNNMLEGMKERGAPVLYDMVVMQIVIAHLMTRVLVYAADDHDPELPEMMRRNIAGLWRGAWTDRHETVETRDHLKAVAFDVKKRKVNSDGN